MVLSGSDLHFPNLCLNLCWWVVVFVRFGNSPAKLTVLPRNPTMSPVIKAIIEPVLPVEYPNDYYKGSIASIVFL